MDLKDLLDKVSAALGDKPMAGLLLTQAHINNGKGKEVKDIFLNKSFTLIVLMLRAY